MRFVQNHGIGSRQQIRESLVLEREIGEQQMMVHDDDVGGLRGAARLDHMAAGVLRALLTEAILARRGDRRPHGRLLRQVRELREVAGLGHGRPARNSPKHAPRAARGLEQAAPVPRALLQGEVEPVPAQIIGAAF